MRLHGMIAPLRRAGELLRTAQGAAFGCGMVGGLYLLDWTHQFTATFGSSLIVSVATILALAMGCELGLRRPRTSGENPSAESVRLFIIPQAILACHTIAFPLWTFAARGLAGAFTVDVMSIPLIGLVFCWCIAAALFAAPIALLVRVPENLHNLLSVLKSTDRSIADAVVLARWSILGSAAGLLTGVFLLAPYVGAHVAALIGAACMFAALIQVVRRARRADAAQAVLRETPCVRSLSLRPSVASRVLAIVSMLLLGAGIALASRASAQLMPMSAFVIYGQWGAVFTGSVFGAAWMERRARRNANCNACTMAASACLLAACWFTVGLGLFDQLITFSLFVTSSVSHIPSLMAIRSAIAMMFVLPFAVACGAIGGLSQTGSSNASPRYGRSWGAPWQILAFAAGMVGAKLSLAGGLSVSILVAMMAASLLLLSGAWCAMAGSFPRRMLARGVAVAGVCLACAAPFLRDNYNPARAARLLFSTNVFGAYRGGVEPDFLTVLDAGREVATRESSCGTLTLWKYNGSQYQIRENGIPKGVVSANPGISPQYSPEILPAALALTLHESPRDILILGMGSSCALSTCLAFPIQTATCFEGDSALVDILETNVWPAAGADPRSDDRVRIVPIDPSLAMPCRDANYDIVISNADALALAHAECAYTKQYYAAASRRIGSTGIFAQRFSQVDLGAGPLATLVQTMQQVFAEVAAIEVGPAEFVLLATNSQQGIVRQDTLKRLQTAQMKRVLSQIGWDWTVPLNITAFPHEALAKFAADAVVNTATNGHFAFTVPQEVMRWGLKSQELYTAISPHASRLVAWDTIPDNDPDVLRRLADVTARHNLMTKYPDQPWAYRKAVRTTLEDKPRSIIEQVNHQLFDRKNHPDDQRRIDYLTALGKAARQAQPSIADIDAIVEFEAPYDPLVSYYLHNEVAALYARVKGTDHSAELGHSLYAINYSDPRDRSVRDVVGAVELLIDYPEACPDPTERYDHLNSLLQILKTRWETRGAVEPKASRVVLIDIEKSISALERSFDAMRSLCEEAEVSRNDCETRCAYLEKSIVRPLRTYRSQLLPHHLAQERKNRRLVQEAAEATNSIPAEYRLPGVE